MVSKSVQENRPKVNRSESVDTSLGFWVVQRSCRVSDSRGCKVGRLSSDSRGRDRLESLILIAILIILITLIILTIILVLLITISIIVVIVF